MDATIRYIVSWLLYGNTEAAKMIGYTDDPNQWDRYQLVILPCGHLGKDWVMPDLSNPKLENGKIIRLDLVYNTLFFASRAEELLTDQRDEHGRFLSKHSILGRENRLQIPMLDEYARFLTKTLQRVCEENEIPCTAELPKPQFSHLYLTHDIDIFDCYRHLRGAIGGILRGESKKVWAAWQDIHNDPAYSFPWLMEQDHRITRDHEEARVIYFAKHTSGRGYDYPQYSRHSKDYVRLRTSLKRMGARIGIHSSYYGFSGETDHNHHRSHFLRCDIDNMQRLVGSGVTDDYTMMFPDQCGFRLQTCRPIRWMNPKTWELTPLTLHPLTVMDCTLSASQYMHLNEDEAYFYCQRLFDKIRQNGGELVLLWHNFDPSGNPYQYTLYPKLIELIKE